MQKLSLNKETLRRLGTESLGLIAAGMPTADYTDNCDINGATDLTQVTCTVCDPQTGTITKATSIRTTGP